jgi:hypothetical protein
MQFFLLYFENTIWKLLLNVCCNWVYTSAYSDTLVNLNTAWGGNIVSEELINKYNILNNRNSSDINRTAVIEFYHWKSVTWLQIDTLNIHFLCAQNTKSA